MSSLQKPVELVRGDLGLVAREETTIDPRRQDQPRHPGHRSTRPKSVQRMGGGSISMLTHSAVLKYSSISPYLPTQIFALVFGASVDGACAAPDTRHESIDRHNTTSAHCR